ncbi:MAG: ABC transporter ATP-binding protein [Armatimonadetes bacterium]|nr:ABC transporter ATP-binding protein [Armatimonadota bacterium]
MSPLATEDPPVVLSTHGLTKDFKNLRAVDNLDISIRRGDVFGFLGPNGAGKTTTIRMMFGLIYPTNGHVEICGIRMPQHRRAALGHVAGFVDDPMFYGNMTARRNLRMIAGMHGPVSEERITDVLEIVGLSDRSNSKAGGFSHGMRQRLGIALALIHRPEVIVLDEPTSGLDPAGMKDVRQLIRELADDGTTVFLSSHLLHEVELVANRAAVVSRGRLLKEGTVSELHPASTEVKIKTADQRRAWEILKPLVGAKAIEQDEDYIKVQASDGAIPDLVDRLVADGARIQAVIPAVEQSLEDMFLELTEGSGNGHKEGATERVPASVGKE